MKIAWFDCFSGASGDMILGALVDAGLDTGALSAELGRLPLTGYRIEAGKAARGGIAATKLSVIVDAHGTRHHHERGLRDILPMIEASALPEPVKRDAARIFTRLAEAEGEVHGKPAEEVHFHEVGAVDSIVDIVGAAAGLHLLGVERVGCSPFRLGTGTVTCAHGTLPVPAPATANLLRGMPVVPTDIPFELTTPTGAAILSTLAECVGAMPPCTIRSVGYGAGTRDIPGRPNVLRVFIADDVESPEGDVVEVVEANVDDMSPEYFGGITERLFKAGALDVWTTPVQMKKGRPGFVIAAIVPLGETISVEEVFFRETTTFGVRIHAARRRKLAREIRTVQTRFGPVRVKLGRLDAKVIRVKPEHDDCARIANERGLPFLDVQAAALVALREIVDTHG